MANLRKQIQAILPEKGYHISGIIWLGYGSNGPGSSGESRDINIQVSEQDALLLYLGESDQSIAEMIANLYNGWDLFEQEPSCAVCSLDKWELTINQKRRNGIVIEDKLNKREVHVVALNCEAPDYHVIISIQGSGDNDTVYAFARVPLKKAIEALNRCAPTDFKA